MMEHKRDDQIAERLRAAREARSISLRALARKLSVSPGMLSRIETGKQSPDLATIRTLCEAIGCTESEILSGTPPLAPQFRDLFERFQRLSPADQKRVADICEVIIPVIESVPRAEPYASRAELAAEFDRLRATLASLAAPN